MLCLRTKFFLMPLTKEEKKQVLDELREKIDRQKSIVFADFTGLRVKDLSDLRKLMKKQNCELKVAKKTLIGLVLKEKNINVDLQQLRGEIALGFGYNDEISPFKVIYNFAKNNENLKILGGFFSGEFYGKEKAVELAQMPSREEMLAQLFYTARYSLFGIFNSFQRNLNILIKVKV